MVGECNVFGEKAVIVADGSGLSMRYSSPSFGSSEWAIDESDIGRIRALVSAGADVSVLGRDGRKRSVGSNVSWKWIAGVA